MKESTNKDFSSIREKFKMDPPENAWDVLNAELEKKQGILYRQRANRFRLLSIGLALLLVSVISYYYISLNYKNALVSVNASEKAANIALNKKSNNLNTKPLTNDNADAPSAVTATATVSATSATAATAPATATFPAGNASHFPRSSSLHTIPQGGRLKENVAAINYPDNVKPGDRAPQQEGAGNKGLIQGGENDKVTGNAADTSAVKTNEEGNGNNSAAKNVPAAVAESSEKPQQNHSAPGAPVSPQAIESSSKAIPDSMINKTGNNQSRWAIAAFYSPDYYAKNNLRSDDPAYNGSISDYNNREKSDYSFAAGLSVLYDLTSHWSISAGCNYSTIAYSITLSDIYAKYGSDNQLHYQYPTSCGNIEIPESMVSPQYYGDTLNINGPCRQLVKIITVPITARYRVVSNRFTFYVEGGISANYVVQATASMNIWNNDVTIVNNVDGLKKMNYGYLFGAGATCSLYGKLSVFLEPSFRGSITSLTDNTSYYCYPLAFSLNTGLLLHF